MHYRLKSKRQVFLLLAFLALGCATPRAEQELPGQALKLAEACRSTRGFLARCRALESPSIRSVRGDVREASQQFRVLDLIEGSTHGEAHMRIDYRCIGSERPLRQGETILWFAEVGPEGGWRGIKALPDTDENRHDAARAIDHFLFEHRPSRLVVGVEYPRAIYVLGEAMPMEVWFSRDEADSILVWSDLASGEFEVIAGDAEPLIRNEASAPPPVSTASAALHVGPARRMRVRQDIAGHYRWLQGRDMREFCLVWRGIVRIGHPNAVPIEVVSSPVRFVVRDGSQVSWGASHEGLACGLSTTRDSIGQGHHLEVHLGLRFDPQASPAKIGMLNDFSSSIGFNFDKIETGENIARGPQVFVGPGPPMPHPEDFVELRRRSMTMRPISISLLTPEGEQLPAGTYRLTAWYENEGKAEMIGDECSRPEPYSGPWVFWKGRITSAHVLIHVRPSGPAPQELRVNSGFVVKSTDGRTCWGLSVENPLRVTVTKRPGFYLGRKADHYFAIGADDFKPSGQSWGGSLWDSGSGFGCQLRPEDEARLAAGERLTIRDDIVIFETSEPPGHLWMPERGDYRVLWQGRIEGGLPGKSHR